MATHAARAKQHILFINTKPFCRCCGAPFKDNGPRGVTFGNADLEVGAGITVEKPRYEHARGKAKLNCPAYFLEQPQFTSIRHHGFDFRVKEANAALLNSPDVRAINDVVLRRLMFALTRREMNGDEFQSMHDFMTTKLGGMEILRENPYLAPFMVARMQGACRRSSVNGGPELPYYFLARGQVPYSFAGADGKVRTEIVPESLGLFFSGKKTPHLVINPRTGKDIRFLVSEFGARQIVADEQARQAQRRDKMGQDPAQMLLQL